MEEMYGDMKQFFLRSLSLSFSLSYSALTFCLYTFSMLEPPAMPSQQIVARSMYAVALETENSF